ncbi:MAG TPA: hypothetical protein VK994_05510, partial [Bacteroidales bacterium]|nr:hypothetical protein [Bacteroidales bacterium]
KINHEGGAVVRGPGYLELRNVKKAVLIIVSNSSFYHNDYPGKNHEDLAKINGRDIDQLEKDHTADYEELFSRVRLQLGDVTLDTIPTDERIAGIRNGHSDPGLEALLFQYGRYLLISSSRPGTNPANLQGLWNQHIEAPWNADYHLNVNLQMNYWLANSTGLDELNLPLFDYIDRLIENGKMTALKNYGCNGSFIPHATDLWAPTWLRAPTAYWGCSVGAGGWLMQHYWYHFEYTLDTNFLRHRVYPALHEVARFYSDWLMEDPRDGTLVSAPSTSPENRFFNARGEAVATCMGSAIDQQIISEVFSHYLDACEIIGIDNDFVSKLRQQKAQLRPGFVLGSDGRILEWDREYTEPEPGHRHMSHLYGFHPGTAISQEKTPEFFEAVRKTLDYRLAHGGAGTGWSRAWLINCSARLLDGEMAYKNIQLFFERSVMDNLFDSHPPFQIDGNFGYTAGIAEMLLQTHENGILRILPALPVSWPDGFVEGLRGRGGMIINIYWSNSTLQKVIIRPSYDLDLDMIYNGRKIHLELKRGIDFVYEPKED